MLAVEMALEGVDVIGPQLTEGSQPFVDLAQAVRSDAVDASLRVDGRFDKSRFPQYAEMFRDCGLSHSQRMLDVSYGLLRNCQKSKNPSPVRLRNDLKG